MGAFMRHRARLDRTWLDAVFQLEDANPAHLRDRLLRRLYQLGHADNVSSWGLRSAEGHGRPQFSNSRFMGGRASEEAPRVQRARAFVDLLPRRFLTHPELREQQDFLETAAIFPRSDWETAPYFEKVLARAGVQHQQRIMVYDGPRFVSYLGFTRNKGSPDFTRRDRQLLRPLVDAARNIILLADALDQRVDSEGPADLVFRPDGSLELASIAARLRLQRSPSLRDELGGAVRRMDRGTPAGLDWLLHNDAVTLTRMDGEDGVRYLAHLRPASPVCTAGMSKLTPMQRHIADLLVAGASAPEVARMLGRSPDTVRTHIKDMHERLGVTSRAELITTLLPGQR